MAASQADVAAAITAFGATLSTALDKVSTDLQAEIAAVTAAIAASGAPDLQPLVDQLNALQTSVSDKVGGISSTIEAETAKVTPAPAPEPPPAQ